MRVTDDKAKPRCHESDYHDKAPNGGSNTEQIIQKMCDTAISVNYTHDVWLNH